MSKKGISPSDLLERVVAELHGEDAIAEIKGIEHDGKETETSFQIIDAKFDPAIRAIEKAEASDAWLEEHGTLQGFESKWLQHVEPTYSQRPMYVIRAGKNILSTEDDERWDGARVLIQDALSKNELPADVLLSNGVLAPVKGNYWHGEDAWQVFETDNLENSEQSEQNGRPVYLDREAAMKWLNALCPPAAPPIPNNRRGPKAFWHGRAIKILKQRRLEETAKDVEYLDFRIGIIRQDVEDYFDKPGAPKTAKDPLPKSRQTLERGLHYLISEIRKSSPDS